MEKLIDTGELAEILGLSRQTVINKAGQNPESLPPFIRVGKGFRWKPSTVETWFKQQEQKSLGGLKRKRGRPRKKESVQARVC